MTNNSGAALEAWTVTWTFPGDQTITQAWDIAISQDQQSVTGNNLEYNGNVAEGGTLNFGFLATYTGMNGPPSAFSLNGISCSIETTAPSEPTPTPAPSDPRCVVDYDAGNDWGNGFVAHIHVTNYTGEELEGWSLSWTFPGDQMIGDDFWEAEIVQDGQSVVASNLDTNASVARGATFYFGFSAQYSESNLPPIDFELDGLPCDQP